MDISKVKEARGDIAAAVINLYCEKCNSTGCMMRFAPFTLCPTIMRLVYRIENILEEA